MYFHCYSAKHFYQEWKLSFVIYGILASNMASHVVFFLDLLEWQIVLVDFYLCCCCCF